MEGVKTVRKLAKTTVKFLHTLTQKWWLQSATGRYSHHQQPKDKTLYMPQHVHVKDK